MADQNLDDIYKTFSSTALASRPNKTPNSHRDIDYITFDLFQKIKEDATNANKGDLKNLSEPSKFFVAFTKSTLVSNVKHGIKTHPDQDHPADTAKKPTDIKNHFKYFGVLVHYGFVMNGSGIMIDRQASHLQFYKAYEFVKDIERHQNQFNRSGDTCQVRFFTDDTTVCIVESWMGDPPSGTNKNFSTFLKQWYEGASNSPSLGLGKLKPRPPKKGKKGGKKGSGGKKGKKPSSLYPPGKGGDATAVADVKCDDRSTWKPKSPVKRWKFLKTAGKNVRSTFDPTTIGDSKVLNWYEVFTLPSGEEAPWGPKFKRNKPPGLPRAAHPVLSQRSTCHIFNYYANQLSEIPEQYRWWMKICMFGVFWAESALLIGNPAFNLDVRGKADDNYCKQSWEKGTDRRFRGHFIEDGPRHPGSKFISAVGIHGANYAAWKMWLRGCGRSPGQHVCLQSIKDECQIGILYYWNIIWKKWLNANGGPGTAVLTQEICEKLIIVATIWHSGQGYGRTAIRKSKNLTRLSGLAFDPKNPVDSAGRIIKEWAETATGGHYSEERMYKTLVKRLKKFRQFVRYSTIGGDIIIPLDRNVNPPASSKYEITVRGKRCVKLPAKN